MEWKDGIKIKKKHLTSALTAIFLLLIFSSTASAYTISEEVRDETGNHIRDASVKLEKQIFDPAYNIQVPFGTARRTARCADITLNDSTRLQPFAYINSWGITSGEYGQLI